MAYRIPALRGSASVGEIGWLEWSSHVLNWQLLPIRDFWSLISCSDKKTLESWVDILTRAFIHADCSARRDVTLKAIRRFNPVFQVVLALQPQYLFRPFSET